MLHGNQCNYGVNSNFSVVQQELLTERFFGALDRPKNEGERNSIRRRHKQMGNFHQDLVKGARFMGRLDLPFIHGVNVKPKYLVLFSDAMAGRCAHPEESFVVFFENDKEIERFWENPNRVLQRLDAYAGFAMPDYSTCVDFPIGISLNNLYRNHALGYWLQRQGKIVIPSARTIERLAGDDLAGMPRNSSIIVSSVGCIIKTRKTALGLNGS